MEGYASSRVTVQRLSHAYSLFRVLARSIYRIGLSLGRGTLRPHDGQLCKIEKYETSSHFAPPTSLTYKVVKTPRYGSTYLCTGLSRRAFFYIVIYLVSYPISWATFRRQSLW